MHDKLDPMRPVPNKNLWWLVLCTCVVSSAVIAWLLFDDYVRMNPRHARFNAFPVIMILTYVVLARVALGKLKSYYSLFGHWDGAWQLSMADLLSIAFFFGILMLIFRAIAQPENFVPTIPIAAFLAAGYAASLLVVSRMGYYHTAGRWIEAFFGLLLALGTGFAGMCLHLCCCSGLFFWTLR